MSASMRPQVGPAMICASSTTLSPCRAPFMSLPPGLYARAGAPQSRSLPFELRSLLREESPVADAEVLGAEAREALGGLGLAQRRGVAQPARELLVPARDQRCA